jgi:hypothetical protein
VQLVRHAPTPHAYGAHDVVAGPTQVPVPLHVAAGASVLPVHVGATHCVPEA